jgi:tetratricopeptide (TPR) repeat protein
LPPIIQKGYLLAGLVALDEYNLTEMEKNSRLAVQHSQLAGDYNLLAAAYKQQATMFQIGRKTARALQVYQKTLPFIDQVSPLLRSRIYQGLASASARCGQDKDALRYLGLARDTFPSDFENDPSYLFADSGLSVLHMYEGLTYQDLNKPKEAWESFAKVDGLAPKIPIGEFTRLEFLNLQTKTAVSMQSIELCELYLETSVTVATALNSQYSNGESFDAYRSMQLLWPDGKLTERWTDFALKGGNLL